MKRSLLNLLFWCLPILLTAQAKQGTIEYRKKANQRKILEAIKSRMKI